MEEQPYLKRIRLRPTVVNGAAAGFISGFLGGICNIAGPPMVIYLLSVTENKEEYTSTLQFFNVLNCVYVFSLHYIKGNVNTAVMGYAAIAVLGIAAGIYLGLKLFTRLSPGGLKRLVYVFMTVMGLYLVIFG